MNISPVTSTLVPGGETSLVLEIPVATIIERYQKHNIDVHRFFGDLNAVQVYRCNQSGYRFFYPEYIFGDDQFYRDLYVNVEGYYHANRWEHKLSVDYVKPTDDVLEIGCGDGIFMEKIQGKVKSVVGLELNQDAIAKAKSKNLNVVGELVETHAAKHPEAYDVVCYFQVLEHIYDVHGFIEASLKCLKKDGRLVIAVPNNNPYIHKRITDLTLNIPPHHAGWWNKESLLSLEKIFNLHAEQLHIEPLYDFKDWYKAQVAYYSAHNRPLAFLMNLVPRPLYKLVLKLLRHQIEGKNVLTVFIKK